MLTWDELKIANKAAMRKKGKRDKKLYKMSVFFPKVSHYLFSQLYTKHNQQYIFTSVNNKVAGSEANFGESLS